ncbi:SDR family oxidoreductase [Phycicoccus sp. BSK3Z-2]|uniref:SDR family oxidoreductase n=1 Tax=Phycicoccus avicenniae TaxID=2828860 RepID=A0A941D792_9MICO|nr:SDR family oxidoreductase [Phycicoccus avicenniae]MBR7742413.1 SDR family oxidoreductase [Phycicoccus avicenniae]
MTIAITGSTGALGGAVARRVADLAPRLVVRDAGRAPTLEDSHVVVASYGDEQASVRALEGVDVLLMVSGSESADRREQHRTFVRAAATAGVSHVVYTSFAGASPDATFTLGRDHADTEEAVRTSGMAWTLLRDDFYAEVVPLFADAEGVIRGPAGSGRVALVGRLDVADVAAAVLRDPAAHRDVAYDLTGPEAVTLDEAARRAGAVLGRDLRYEEETVEEAYASRAAEYDVPQWQLDAWVSTYTAIADGSVARVSGDVERVLGRPARTLEDALLGR